MSSPLEKSIEKVASERKWRRKLSSEELVGGWNSFIVQCSKGYPLGIYEFENDRYVRTMIHEVLSAPDLVDDSALAEFSGKISDLDDKFRNLLQPGVLVGNDGDSWWNRGVPSLAGSELASDFNDIYGLAVDVV
jgi:hypothetical protein